MYFVKTPWWLKKLYPTLTWDLPARNKQVFFTFDDGPHPTATPFVLQVLRQYNAKATFFCIGKNVVEQPGIYQQLIDEGHAIGNHTFNHLNGWKTANDVYEQNVNQAAEVIGSKLFRPPYGRITKAQAKLLGVDYRVMMWDVLSGDFDEKLSPQQCLLNVTKHTRPGAIVVFHDSSKAFSRLEYVLPKALEFVTRQGYTCSAIV